MKVNYTFPCGKTVGVATSGGSDSMALLYYMQKNAVKLGVNIVCINVEHGIRGEQSLRDTEFVKQYCENNDIPFIGYQVDAVSYAKDNKLSLEESARLLRYGCFADAVKNRKCDYVATAHHLSDNTESVLFNLFRGSGINGLKGVTEYDYLIRPFKSVDKAEISAYIKENDIPYITDQSNFDQSFTRNNLRINVIPKIKEIFPEVEKSILRLSETVNLDAQYLDLKASELIEKSDDKVIIKDGHRAVFVRAVIKAFKILGVNKDWEKVHLDDVYDLSKKENGKLINLPYGLMATREYGVTVVSKVKEIDSYTLPLKEGEYSFNGINFRIEKIENKNVDLTGAHYIACEKTADAVIRLKQDGDVFKKFKGGTKKLADYLTDVKVPKRERDTLPVIALGSDVLCIVGIAVSEKAKAEEETKYLYKITKE